MTALGTIILGVSRVFYADSGGRSLRLSRGFKETGPSLDAAFRHGVVISAAHEAPQAVAAVLEEQPSLPCPDAHAVCRARAYGQSEISVMIGTSQKHPIESPS